MEPRKKYNYLTIEDRAIIAHELRNGNSIRCVARRVKKPLSTVAYEIKKKTGYRYMAGKADKITQERLKERGAKLSAKLHLDLLDFINENFDKKHQSLQLLLREWRKEHSDSPSLATLYNWIPKEYLTLIIKVFWSHVKNDKTQLNVGKEWWINLFL